MSTESADTVAVSKEMDTYFNTLQQEIDTCYQIAETARKKGFDPTFTVEIPQAKDLAARVEELVGPKNIAPKIREITKEIGNRELVSLEIARYIANGENYTFPSTDKALDQAVRTGLAILTEGVLVAPLEGIAEVKLGENNDGTNYVDLYFSGPIRSAGGTGQAMSVLIADVVRRDLKIDRYQPTKGEIERYKEEIPLYKRAQHLQYTPTVDEIHQIVSNCPICINGEGTEKEEVTGYRDLPRVESNRLRGGACLVIAEGLCLKAPKLMKHVAKLKLEGWDFLDHFVNKKKENKKEKKDSEEPADTIPEIHPASKYIGEVIAGRPVFGHPSRVGGFRLRYGRARTAGLASTAISPAAMYLSDEFIAIGTQMKMERPGKATIGTPCDELDGPIVLKTNGDLIQIKDPEEIDLTNTKQIVDLGEILIPYGEFLENNALLPDASYTFEWWIQDLQKQQNLLPEKNTLELIKKADEQTKKQVEKKLQKQINLHHPSFEDALSLSKTFNIPLHPDHNFFWHDINIKEVQTLANYLTENAEITEEKKLRIPWDQTIKDIIIKLGVLHTQQQNILTTIHPATPLIHCLGLTIENNSIKTSDQFNQINQSTTDQKMSTIDYVSKLAGITIRPKSPFRIGTRMGRPEKAAERKMRPPPHVLFPLGNYGSNQRLISKAAEKGTIEVEAGKRICTKCEKNTFKIICDCGGHTEPVEDRIEIYNINLNQELGYAKKHLKIRTIPETIKGVQGTISKHKTPEPIEKGILRAKHGVSVFKDGTIRFDMTDAPLTHFKPKELHVSIEKLKKLGYTHDVEGKPLEHYDQICELKVQDVVIATSCAEYFMKVAHFVDELLAKYYHIDKFYNIRKIEDLTGHLVIGLAPHTSAGSLARIIGFTDAKVCFAHPFYHAAKRRNADGDEDGLMLLMDSLLNFSHEYIPDKRGGKMDLPLILTTRLDPSEVDKEAHNVDCLSRYPLDFYEATTRHEHPKNWEDKMDVVGSRLKTPLQYEQFGFTHDTSDISEGPVVSRYKTLNTMMDKMNAQLNLAAKIRAVDEADVAYKVIERHFLPDILGNLKAFSKQSVRCPTCNITYRRIPLNGTCRKCGGKLSLTVHEKSVKKYLEISKEVADRYHIPSYAHQRITLVEKNIDSLFMSDKVKKTKITDFL
jgi:DNA polymerase II large subunit